MFAIDIGYLLFSRQLVNYYIYKLELRTFVNLNMFKHKYSCDFDTIRSHVIQHIHSKN